MRVAIITESFPPDVNGVAHSVVRVAELLAAGGHQPLVIAPKPRGDQVPGRFPYPVVRVPAVPLPGYPSLRLGLPSRHLRDALIKHQTEVVHLASPVVLGAHGAAVARRLGLPAVAVFQTDLPSYAHAYRLGRPGEAVAWRWLRGIHNRAARVVVAARHPHPGRADAAPVDGYRDRPARPRDRRRVAVGPRGRYGPVRPGPAQRPDPGPAGAGRGGGRPPPGG